MNQHNPLQIIRYPLLIKRKKKRYRLEQKAAQSYQLQFTFEIHMLNSLQMKRTHVIGKFKEHTVQITTCNDHQVFRISIYAFNASY